MVSIIFIEILKNSYINVETLQAMSLRMTSLLDNFYCKISFWFWKLFHPDHFQRLIFRKLCVYFYQIQIWKSQVVKTALCEQEKGF